MVVGSKSLDRDRWARLRFAIVGPLLAAPPAPGALRGALQALAAQRWQHPGTGLPVRFGVSTIERWLYAARRADLDPVASLKTKVRSDRGRQKTITAALAQAIHAQYRDHPGWSCQLHYDNLVAALEPAPPSYTCCASARAGHADPGRSRRISAARAARRAASRSRWSAACGIWISITARARC